MIIRGRKTNLALARGKGGEIFKIKSGTKGLSAGGKEIPKSLDYFNVSKKDKDGEYLAPELVALYGEKPTALLISMPSDDINQCFSDQYVIYGKSEGGKPTKKRECNGVSCIHRIDENIPKHTTTGGEEIEGAKYGAAEEGECICEKHQLLSSANSEVKKMACKVLMNLKAYILNPQTGKIDLTTPYLFESSSINSANAITTALEGMQSLTTILTRGTARLQYIPFWIRVKMVPGKRDAKTKFPIWEMLPVFSSIEEIRNRLYQIGGILKYPEEEMKLLAKPAEGTTINTKLLIPESTVVEEAEEADDHDPDPNNPLGIK